MHSESDHRLRRKLMNGLDKKLPEISLFLEYTNNCAHFIEFTFASVDTNNDNKRFYSIGVIITYSVNISHIHERIYIEFNRVLIV